jgi:hypothetical protein
MTLSRMSPSGLRINRGPRLCTAKFDLPQCCATMSVWTLNRFAMKTFPFRPTCSRTSPTTTSPCTSGRNASFKVRRPLATQPAGTTRRNCHAPPPVNPPVRPPDTVTGVGNWWAVPNSSTNSTIPHTQPVGLYGTTSIGSAPPKTAPRGAAAPSTSVMVSPAVRSSLPAPMRQADIVASLGTHMTSGNPIEVVPFRATTGLCGGAIHRDSSAVAVTWTQNDSH